MIDFIIHAAINIVNSKQKKQCPWQYKHLQTWKIAKKNNYRIFCLFCDTALLASHKSTETSLISDLYQNLVARSSKKQKE